MTSAAPTATTTKVYRVWTEATPEAIWDAITMVGGEHEAEGAGGGWAWILSDLKSLLETGAPLGG
jgi:hypothetical protein